MEVASCSNLTVELFFKLMALSFLLKQSAVKLQLSYTWFETLLNNYKLGLFRNDIRIFDNNNNLCTIISNLLQ